MALCLLFLQDIKREERDRHLSVVLEFYMKEEEDTLQPCGL